MLLTLKRDITAGELAMDSLDDTEGYRTEYVIGPAGTTVRFISRENDLLEVGGFANDPYAQGFIDLEDVVEWNIFLAL